MLRIYVISKVTHAWLWRDLRAKGWPIISTWIDDGDEASIDFSEAWPRYFKEAASATHVIVFADLSERLKDGIAEFGAAVSAGAKALVIDYMPAEFRTLQKHPNVQLVHGLNDALSIMNQEARLVGRPGERDPDAPCTAYDPAGETRILMRPDCDGDGHYLCKECIFFRRADGSEALDA